MHIGINIANHRDLLSKRYIHDTARMAEDLGFDSVWIPDHTVVPRAVETRYGSVYYDAVAVLAYLAGITSRARLGTTVLVIPYRHPVVLAKELASIEDLRDEVLIRDDLVKYLTHRAVNALWKDQFICAYRRYNANNTDVQLFGLLPRDVAPHEDDLRVGALEKRGRHAAACSASS